VKIGPFYVSWQHFIEKEDKFDSNCVKELKILKHH